MKNFKRNTNETIPSDGRPYAAEWKLKLDNEKTHSKMRKAEMKFLRSVSAAQDWIKFERRCKKWLFLLLVVLD
jgi:hypothetical protein